MRNVIRLLGFTSLIIAMVSFGNVTNAATVNSSLSKPKYVTAVASNAAALVKWAKAVSTSKYKITGYRVTATKGSWSSVKTLSPALTSVRFTGLTNNSSYRFTVASLSGKYVSPGVVVTATPKGSKLGNSVLFGQPADLAPLMALAKEHQLQLVEDCAQSFGADIGGRKTGAIGDVAAFSFFPSKNLGCYGDGGMVTTQSDAMAEKLRMLRNHGSKVRYYHDIVGYNSRLDEIQAVVLRAKLPLIDGYNQQRRRVAHRYNAGLAGLNLQIPHEDGLGLHVYHQYTLLSDQRAVIQQALTEQQIASAIYYPVPLHQQKVFADIAAGQSFPVTESVAARCVSLPIYPELSDAAVDEICGVIRKALTA